MIKESYMVRWEHDKEIRLFEDKEEARALYESLKNAGTYDLHFATIKTQRREPWEEEEDDFTEWIRIPYGELGEGDIILQDGDWMKVLEVETDLFLSEENESPWVGLTMEPADAMTAQHLGGFKRTKDYHEAGMLALTKMRTRAP